MNHRKHIALLLSGGTGRRLGADIPKQYMEVCGRPVISYCIERLFSHDGIDMVQIVADKMWHEQILGIIDKTEAASGKFKGFSAPGENRQLSIFNGLADIREYAEDTDMVLIHDAARPLLSAEQIMACLDAVAEHDGVVPVVAMKDTVYVSKDGNRVSSLLKRSEIFAGQAPEIFLLGKYYEANRRLLPNAILKINGSTEPAVMAGMDIVMIPGDEGNFKITTREDLNRFRKIAGERKFTELDMLKE